MNVLWVRAVWNGHHRQQSSTESPHFPGRCDISQVVVYIQSSIRGLTARSSLDCRKHLGQGARAGYEESTEWGTERREGEMFKGEEGGEGQED